MKKKLLDFLLIGSMTLSLLPVTVFAEESNESQKYNIWINGIQVTDDNASDVLGDLDEGQTVVYDTFMETLILKGAQINTGYEYSPNCIAGIYADGNLDIRLEGGTDENMSSIISAPEASELSCGIRVTGHLTISGDGLLTAASGAVVAADTIAEDDFVISAGIYASEGLEILGYIPEDDSEEGETPIVTALGGTVTGNENCSAFSNGVYITNSSLYVNTASVLIASSGTVEGKNAYSFGVEVHGKEEYENIIVENGSLNSTGGQTFGVENAQTSSIYVENCGLYVLGESSLVHLYSNPASISSADGQAFQFGVFASGGEVGLQGGNVTIDCIKSENDSAVVFGIYTTKTTDGDGGGVTLSEGIIDFDDPAAVSHPNLTITTEGGYSIYAESDIYLDDCISITTPEGASIIPTDNDQLFIVVDAEENPAANFHAEVTAEHE